MSKKVQPMEDKEKIAQWLETLHCDKWKGIGCWKERCLLFRDLAEQIRNGEWDAKTSKNNRGR